MKDLQKNLSKVLKNVAAGARPVEILLSKQEYEAILETREVDGKIKNLEYWFQGFILPIRENTDNYSEVVWKIPLERL